MEETVVAERKLTAYADVKRMTVKILGD